MMTQRQKYNQILKKINQLESNFQNLKPEDFSARKDVLKMRLKAGYPLEKIMPEAYALTREVIKRVLGMRAYDVQILGAIAAHFGNVVEMKTGEGKTLTIIFPAFLNALEERGVHVVTANDYLAERDAMWMKDVYRMLGVGVNFVTSKTSSFDRQVAYAADVTYATSKEVSFDYLKDNLLYDLSEKRHRSFNYAIVDEADSVLIDEAQIPLVIASDKMNSDFFKRDRALFIKLNEIVKVLDKKTDYKINKKNHTVSLTTDGIRRLERLMNVKNLYKEDSDYIYYIECLLKAYHLFEKDRDYIVDEDKVVIVDEFTGRIMLDHRFYQGVHQAIEAKEGIKMLNESEVMALTTMQHFFKNYKKMTGFTGTAKTAQKEFRLLYDKKVFAVSTNKPIIRKDLADKFFETWEDKISYLSWSTQEFFFKNRAVLIGTRSVSKSSQIQKKLINENMPSNVLNAKHTKREAEIVAQAGKPQTITVATNMAGRGTDIELDSVVNEGGGLIIFGMERHNSKRIDNQLIGRAGRQGDPGQTQFLISADDSLVDVYFRNEYLEKIKKLKNYKKGVTSKRLEKIIRKAQARMEGIYFNQRVLNYEFDKVLEVQRRDFYLQRTKILESKNLGKLLFSIILKEIVNRLNREYKLEEIKFLSNNTLNQITLFVKSLVGNRWFNLDFNKNKKYSIIETKQLIKENLEEYYQDFAKFYSQEKMIKLEKILVLKVMDLVWVDYLKKVEKMQDDSLMLAISGEDFYDDYKVRMERSYFNALATISPTLVDTFFRTLNKLWEKNGN